MRNHIVSAPIQLEAAEALDLAEMLSFRNGWLTGRDATY
jgi:hypothetical protein